MKVRMKITISGGRDGKPWPVEGKTIDLPDAEAEGLVASGIAEPVAERKKAETATVDEPVEERKRSRRRKADDGDAGAS